MRKQHASGQDLLLEAISRPQIALTLLEGSLQKRSLSRNESISTPANSLQKAQSKLRLFSGCRFVRLEHIPASSPLDHGNWKRSTTLG